MMIKATIGFAVAGALATTPCLAAELPDEAFRIAPRTGAVAGAYFKLPLDAPRSAERGMRAGLRLAMTQEVRDPRRFSVSRQANLLDLSVAGAGRADLHLAGRPIAGPQAERLNAAGGSGGGRLDKVMIGLGIALAAVAGVVIATSVN
jgi:hypothetical protein